MTKRAGAAIVTIALFPTLTATAFIGGCDRQTDPAPKSSSVAAIGPGSACAAWLKVPPLDPSITPTAGSVASRAAATGVQTYRCQAALSDAGSSYAWVFVGPRADLHDCNGGIIGRHFASEAAHGAPEWQTVDGASVVGRKKASYTPDGGAGSIPWLLVEVTGHEGQGAIGDTRWISRANTSGGAAPKTPCDESTVGTTKDVDYTADYFFWGP
jgi:hypothetical protein